jgi:hypothetical protein
LPLRCGGNGIGICLALPQPNTFTAKKPKCLVSAVIDVRDVDLTAGEGSELILSESGALDSSIFSTKDEPELKSTER